MENIGKIVRDNIYDNVMCRDKKEIYITTRDDQSKLGWPSAYSIIIGLGLEPITIAFFNSEKISVYAHLKKDVSVPLKLRKKRRHKVRKCLREDDIFKHAFRWEQACGCHNISYYVPDAIEETKFFINKSITIARRLSRHHAKNKTTIHSPRFMKPTLWQRDPEVDHFDLLKLVKDQYKLKVLDKG